MNNENSQISHHTKDSTSTVFANRALFTPWIKLATNSHSTIARLGISLYTRLTGMNTARRMAQRKETAIREAAIAYQGSTWLRTPSRRKEK